MPTLHAVLQEGFHHDPVRASGAGAKIHRRQDRVMRLQAWLAGTCKPRAAGAHPLAADVALPARKRQRCLAVASHALGPLAASPNVSDEVRRQLANTPFARI